MPINETTLTDDQQQAAPTPADLHAIHAETKALEGELRQRLTAERDTAELKPISDDQEETMTKRERQAQADLEALMKRRLAGHLGEQSTEQEQHDYASIEAEMLADVDALIAEEERNDRLQEQPPQPITPQTAPAGSRLLVRRKADHSIGEITIVEWAPSGRRALIEGGAPRPFWSDAILAEAEILEHLPAPKPDLEIEALRERLRAITREQDLKSGRPGALADILRTKPGAGAALGRLDELAEERERQRAAGINTSPASDFIDEIDAEMDQQRATARNNN